MWNRRDLYDSFQVYKDFFFPCKYYKGCAVDTHWWRSLQHMLLDFCNSQGLHYRHTWFYIDCRTCLLGKKDILSNIHSCHHSPSTNHENKYNHLNHSYKCLPPRIQQHQMVHHNIHSLPSIFLHLLKPCYNELLSIGKLFHSQITMRKLLKL